MNGKTPKISIGFNLPVQSYKNAIGGIVNDAVLNESRNLYQIFEEFEKGKIANAECLFDAEFSKREKTITDAIELAKESGRSQARTVSDTINQRL